MSLCQRVLLLSAIVALSGVLPTAIGSPLSSETAEEEELVDLLKKLRNVLEKDEDETKNTRTSLEDNVNEEHDWAEGILRLKAKANSKGRMHRVSLPDTLISSSDQQQLLDAMNAKRRSEGAANMYQLQWNNQLAKLAQLWANECVFNHGYEWDIDEELEFDSIGQTIAASTDPFSPARVVNTWYSQKRNYNERDYTCNLGQACGAYKQLVTGYTTDVGCGLKTCSSIRDSTNGLPLSNAYYIVCYYGPPGSYGNEPTLIPGPACTQCKKGQFYCNNGLCNSQCTSEGPECTCAASCQNCATKTADCRCQCKPGSTGVNCAAPCADQAGQKCGQKGGWTQNHCNLFDFVRETYCPKYCGYCQTGVPCS